VKIPPPKWFFFFSRKHAKKLKRYADYFEGKGSTKRKRAPMPESPKSQEMNYSTETCLWSITTRAVTHAPQ
jgi:hypothetical protein